MTIFAELHNTTIARLTIRAPRQVQDRVRQELLQADWPDGGTEQIVMVRKLSAAAASSDIGRLLLVEARNQILHGNDANNVVRFAGRLEMLAALLADLANGTAAGKWYWQRWSHLFTTSISKALYSILAGNLTSVCAITEMLAYRRQLAAVWQNLAEEEAEQLIREICWQNGYMLSEHSVKEKLDTVETTMILPKIPQHLYQRWLDVLSTEPTSFRFKLAVLVIAQEAAPLPLHYQTDTTFSAILTALQDIQKGRWSPVTSKKKEILPTLQSDDTAVTTSPEKSKHSLKKTALSDLAQDADDQINAYFKRVTAEEEQSLPGKEITGSEKSEQVDQAAEEKSTFSLEQRTAKAIAQKAKAADHISHPFKQITLDQSVPQQEVDTGGMAWFYTEQGGVLYLLNFLNREELQDVMAEHLQQLASGWSWLYRVAELLDFDIHDPIATFLAEQIGLESCDELAYLPSLPEHEHIQTLAEQWYGRADIWNHALLQLPAKIHHNGSHVDMHCDLKYVRLDLRLVGLDINPGWLPWLGRVVNFHFDQGGGSHHE
ncbi:MAG: hypothetical protein QNJ17_00535 [Desulfocapsaceae bacterium]|nr:hypothetical protein [Desulfocapsaceae bacterium]